MTIRLLWGLVLLTLIATTACQQTYNLAPNSSSPSPTPGPVSTLAGQQGILGSTNGIGTTATFWNLAGIAVDASGNVYVVDENLALVRKIAPGGVVTTLAGSGSWGFTNGTGAAASFRDPYGVATDSAGNVYVADRGNDVIRKITPAGVVSTFAGSGVLGASNGPAAVASFFGPEGVAVDSSGNVFVADQANDEIREISGGLVTTYAGSGSAGAVNATGTAASFNYPTGIAVDNSGNVYVTDLNNQLIRKILPGGIVTTLAGQAGVAGSANGTGTAASFNGPFGLAVDSSGNVYVADQYNDLIREITPSGVVTTLAGQTGVSGHTNGALNVATFYWPIGVAVDSSGNVYVADEFNDLVREIQ